MKKCTLKEDNLKMILIRVSNKVKKRNIWGFYLFIYCDFLKYFVFVLRFLFESTHLSFFGRFVLWIFGTDIVFKMMLNLFKMNTSPRPDAKPTVSVFTHPSTLYNMTVN